MEKEGQPDSLTTVTIKPDYAPSEVYSSEPPPAYPRSQSSSVQVAKIIAATVVLVSLILGSFILASAYVTATASCKQLEQELELLNEAADRFQPPLAPEALIQEEPIHLKQNADSLRTEESRKKINEINNNDVDSADSENSEDSDSSSSNSDSNASSESGEESPIFIKFPLQLDFDDLAGAILEKNQKSRMNCVVEKKRTEEVVDHQPKTLRLPFGLNLTTDPRYERLSGERMAIFCESGNLQKQAPEDDDEEETIMIQPVMIPIPQTHFPTHMAQQFRPVPQHPMETMRAPAPTQSEEQNQLPPNQVLHHIAQEIIAQKIMEAQRARDQQNPDMRSNFQRNPQHPIPEELMARRIPIPEEILSQLNRLPNRDMIVAVSQQDYQEQPQESREVSIEPQEIRRMPQEMKIISHQMNMVVPEMRAVPQEIPQQMIAPQPNAFTQEIRQLPSGMRSNQQLMSDTQPEMHIVQQQRQNAQEMNGRQSYARVLPIHIPVQMNQEEQEETRSTPSEESRPHYLQPRSVRSADALLSKSEKRVKRCSCDCAC